jgi:hypothetical protein
LDAVVEVDGDMMVDKPDHNNKDEVHMVEEDVAARCYY